jgi:hypothetical protein
MSILSSASLSRDDRSRLMRRQGTRNAITGC